MAGLRRHPTALLIAALVVFLLTTEPGQRLGHMVFFISEVEQGYTLKSFSWERTIVVRALRKTRDSGAIIPQRGEWTGTNTA